MLFAMRDCNSCWKQMSYVHDTIVWVPKQHFKVFLDDAVGKYGCYERSKHWFAGSGHGCWPLLAAKKPTVQMGFWHEGCFRVRDPHPLYFLTEARQVGKKDKWQLVQERRKRKEREKRNKTSAGKK